MRANGPTTGGHAFRQPFPFSPFLPPSPSACPTRPLTDSALKPPSLDEPLDFLTDPQIVNVEEDFTTFFSLFSLFFLLLLLRRSRSSPVHSPLENWRRGVAIGRPIGQEGKEERRRGGRFVKSIPGGRWYRAGSNTCNVLPRRDEIKFISLLFPAADAGPGNMGNRRP